MKRAGIEKALKRKRVERINLFQEREKGVYNLYPDLWLYLPQPETYSEGEKDRESIEKEEKASEKERKRKQPSKKEGSRKHLNKKEG